MTRLFYGLLTASMIMALSVPFAAGQCEDRGGKDHPLISRYPGSCIYTYEQVKFEEFTLPLGKNVDGKFTKSQHLEGKVTSIEYNMPEGRSLLEVFRNYEGGLKKGGFEIVYSCAEPDCSSGDIGHTQPLYDGGGDRYEPSWGGRLRYLSAKLARPEGDLYAALSVVNPYGDAVTAFLYIVEVKPMETGLIAVNAASLANDINHTGHASVYGIYFDTGKADIKPESEGTMKEIAKLMQGNPGLKLYVVGHTDNQGGLEMNMDLSRRRAQAVLAALTTKYSVPAARLNAFGNGPYSPVASNDGEDGRAKNRRVELVKQ